MYKETQIIFVDSTLFDVFTIPLLYGNPKTALSKPNTLVLSREAVQRYFGKEWEHDVPLGKHLLVGREKISYEVTGIFYKIPNNSHFHFDVFLSMSSLEESKEEKWLSNNFNTYLLIRVDTDVEALQTKINETFKTYAAPQIKQYAGITIEEFMKGGNRFAYFLQPLTDIHLHSDLAVEFEANSDIKYVYIFSAIAFFILLIACVNFMNISTARSSGRAKEVGVRKVMGSVRKQLIGQFLVEAVIMSLISLAVALIAAEVLLPFFNDLAGKQLNINYFQDWYIAPILLLLVIVVGLLAGSYPDHVYEAMLLDEYFQVEAFYIIEDIMYQGFKIFSFLSIFIGCLGLYGLVSYISLQRQKEIGIRKVLGASVFQIIYLFSREFTWLVLLAFVVAAPIGYFAMRTWLESFANRIDLHAGYFMLALLISVGIAWITVGFKSVKAAIANPVESLKNE